MRTFYYFLLTFPTLGVMADSWFIKITSAVTSLIGYGVLIWKVRTGMHLDKAFYASAFRKKDGVSRIAFGAEIALTARHLKQFVEADLVDGYPDKLRDLNAWLKANMPPT